MIDSPEINGQPPELAGAICEELLCQQYWYRGEMKDGVNVLFLRFNGVWHRLYFEPGIIFWRICTAPPQSTEAADIDAKYPIVDLGTDLAVRGETLDHYDMKKIKGGSELQFVFTNGHIILIKNVNDRTSVFAFNK
jgi:hypothetical protein